MTSQNLVTTGHSRAPRPPTDLSPSHGKELLERDRVSAQHRRPLLAFLLVVVLCIILLGQAVRSEALLGLLVSADREPFGPEQIRLSAEVRDRVVTDAPRVRSPRAPEGASVTPNLAPRPRRRGQLIASPGTSATPRRPRPRRPRHADGTPPGRARRGRALASTRASRRLVASGRGHLGHAQGQSHSTAKRLTPASSPRPAHASPGTSAPSTAAASWPASRSATAHGHASGPGEEDLQAGPTATRGDPGKATGHATQPDQLRRPGSAARWWSKPPRAHALGRSHRRQLGVHAQHLERRRRP